MKESEDETEIRAGEGVGRTGGKGYRGTAEDKIRIVLEGLRGEDSIAELCRREGIVQNLYPFVGLLAVWAGTAKEGRLRLQSGL